MGSWNIGFCKCMTQCPMCPVATILPCVAEGINAHKLGESGILYGIGYAFGFCIVGGILRNKIRKRNHIDVYKH